MKKVVIIAALFTVFHLIEDMIWLTLGRYTNISYWIILLAIIGLGLLSGLAARHSKVKEFLGK